MGTQVGSGLSHQRDPRAAAREALDEALRQGGIDQPDFVLMFATVGYDQHAIVKAVREATNGAPLCGCSAEGVIVETRTNESNFALALLVLSSDEVRFQNGLAVGMRGDAADVGRDIADGIEPSRLPDARALLLFPDGVTIDFDGLRDGLESGLDLPSPLLLLGGTASDNWQWQQTYQYCDDEVVSNGVAWALLSGVLRIASAVNHGCVPLGVGHEVTASNGTTISELDGRRALDVIHEYMSEAEMEDWASATISMPLGFEAAPELEGYDDDNYVIRVMLTKDDETGAVTIPTRVTPGTTISMHRRDFAKTVEGVNRLADDLRAQLGDATPHLMLQFECAGRGKKFLRDEQRLQILTRLREQLPDAPWFGFYTYGEIGPVGGRNWFHNYTSVVAALY